MADSPAQWREPSSVLPLRWGSWVGRSWGGLWLIVGGGTAVAGSNAQTLWLAALGMLAHTIGWAVLPGSGWRRLLAVAPSAVTVLTLLAGPAYLVLLAVPFLGWLLVRHRPLRVAPMAAFVIASGVVIGRLNVGYEGMFAGILVSYAVLFGAAWAARAVHAATDRPRRTPRLRRPRSA